MSFSSRGLTTALLAGFLLFHVATNSHVMADDIKVMSFNIRYGTARDGENHWDRRKDFVADTIRAYSPDLLGTQETLQFQKTFLDSKLPGYTSVGVGRDDGKAKGEMTPVFYKTSRFEKLAAGHFWLSETPDQPGSKSWDSSLPRMCSWVRLRDKDSDGKPILFINTHFDHRGRTARFESARLLRKQASKLADGCAIVITGDFNATIDSKPYSALFGDQAANDAAVKFVDTYRVAANEKNQSEATFSGFRAPPVRGGRIDWIAVSNDWAVLTAAIDRTSRNARSPSDHYPVTATLRQKTVVQE